MIKLMLKEISERESEGDQRVQPGGMMVSGYLP
jgi:hypothetical protein